MQIATIEWVRMLSIYAHLLFAALAISEILQADWAIVTGKLQETKLRKTAKRVGALLLGLWVSGLALVQIDTGFNIAAIAGNTKLVLKFVCVAVLTLNGLILHLKSFPLMISKRILAYREALILSFSGSISTSHWLLALFIGVAEPLSQYSVKSLLTGYLIFVFCFGTAAIVSTYWLGVKINHWKRDRIRKQYSSQIAFGTLPEVQVIKSRRPPPPKPVTFADIRRERKELKYRTGG